MLDLWNFYDKTPELYRAGELLINKAMSSEFSFTWGIIETESPSFYETVQAKLEVLKNKNKTTGRKNRNNGSVNLYDLMQGRIERNKQKKETEKSASNQESRQALLTKELTKLEAHTLYKNMMLKMRPPQNVASNQEVALEQYNDKVKEKATGVSNSKKSKGDVKSRGDFNDDVDKTIVASIASIASGELPTKLPKKSAIVTSEDTPGDLKWMEEFMREALKYKLIFGMVPYSAGVEETSGRRRLFVRNISEGEFVVYRDYNSQIKAYWQKKTENSEGTATSGHAYVYIWPDESPRIWMTKAPWSSVTDRLMTDWYTLLSTKENKLAADWLAAHVPITTKCTEKLVGMNEMTSQEVFSRLLGQNGATIGSERDSQKAAIDAEHAKRTLMLQGMMNNQKAKSFLMRNIQKEIGESGTVEEVSRGMSWEEQKLHLPYGREPTSITLPRSPPDYQTLRESFGKLVSIVLGVPLEEAAGRTRSRTTKGEEGIQTMYDDSVKRARIDAQICLEEAFTVAFGEQESKSIKRGLDNTYGAMNDEMRAINYYETIYGLGLDNPTKPEKMKREQEGAMLDNYIYGKAWDVIQLAMDDGVTLNTATVRQHIRDIISVHRDNVTRLEERARGLWNAHESEIRLSIQWKPSFSKELMSLLIEGYNIGFLDKEASSLYYLDAMNYPLDTPIGMEKEERMENFKAKHTKELEKLKHQHEMEKMKLQSKLTKEMEKLKSKIAPAKVVQAPTLAGGEKRKSTEGEKENEGSAKKSKTEETSSSLEKSKSITETTPMINKEAKNPSKTNKEKTKTKSKVK